MNYGKLKVSKNWKKEDGILDIDTFSVIQSIKMFAKDL